MKTKELIAKKQQEGPQRLQSVLRNRFSPRVFDGKPLADEDIQAILEAARFTPSSRNRQPWYFYVAPRGSKAFEKVLSVLYESNAAWAKNAGVIIVSCAVTHEEGSENTNAQYDLGAAVLSMVVEAQARGIYCRQMGGFDKEKAPKILHLPENHQPMVCAAFGHIGDYETADPGLVENESTPRSRKDLVSEYL